MPWHRYIPEMGCFEGDYCEVEFRRKYRDGKITDDYEVYKYEFRDRIYNIHDDKHGCPLYMPWNHVYKWHPVAWLQDFGFGRFKSMFCHVSEDDLCYAFGRDARQQEPVRLPRDGGEAIVYGLLNDKYGGAFCVRCKKVKECNHWGNEFGFAWHWQDLGICEECAAKVKLEKEYRLKQEGLREKLYREKRRAWLEKYATEKEAAKARAQKQRKEASAERRILERAAYEMLEQMGLLKELARKRRRAQ